MHVAEEKEVKLLLPHQWVLHLQEGNLLENLSCTNEELDCFWRSQLRSPQMSPALKEMIKDSMPSELPIPWLLHGNAAPLHRSRLHTSFELQATVSKLKKRTTAPPIVYFIFSIQWFCFDIGLASPYRCLLSKRTVSESQPLITAIPKLAMTKKTFKQVMETVAWSWQILFSGVIPKKDQFGNPAEEFRGRRMRRGVLWSITGDLEWFCQEFNCP